MLNENIRNFRKKNGLSQEELASRLHVVRQTISKWEKGYSVPDSDLLIRLANELGASVSELLGESEDSGSESIPEQLEIINGKLAKIVKTRKRNSKIIIAVMLLAVAAALFLRFTYFNPYVVYSIAKPYDSETDRYFEHIALGYQTRLGFPLNKGTKEILSEFNEKSRAIHRDIDNNYDAPMHIEVSVVTDIDYTVVTYSGTATKDGKQVEYMNHFYVMKRLKSSEGD